MGELQWALLIVCLVLVVAVYVFSRRNREEADDGEHASSGRDGAGGDQLDLLAPRSDANFDEYGVGRARPRGQAPSLGGDAPREPSPPTMATLLNPLPGQAPVAPRQLIEPAAAPASAGPVPAGKMIALIVAPTEETDILGPQLHAALAAQGLKFGDGELYHRSIGGRVVFSVASLLKPGKLNPAEAENFSTKGLTVVLNLPSVVTPTVAFDDMLATTRALAAALKLEIFDARRERVTEELGKKLRVEIEDWARANKLA
jgi:cell division protein ZipA